MCCKTPNHVRLVAPWPTPSCPPLPPLNAPFGFAKLWTCPQPLGKGSGLLFLPLCGPIMPPLPPLQGTEALSIGKLTPGHLGSSPGLQVRGWDSLSPDGAGGAGALLRPQSRCPSLAPQVSLHSGVAEAHCLHSPSHLCPCPCCGHSRVIVSCSSAAEESVTDEQNPRLNKMGRACRCAPSPHPSSGALSVCNRWVFVHSAMPCSRREKDLLRPATAQPVRSHDTLASQCPPMDSLFTAAPLHPPSLYKTGSLSFLLWTCTRLPVRPHISNCSSLSFPNKPVLLEK